MTTVIAGVESVPSAEAVVGGAAWLAALIGATIDHMAPTGEDADSIEAAIGSARSAGEERGGGPGAGGGGGRGAEGGEGEGGEGRRAEPAAVHRLEPPFTRALRREIASVEVAGAVLALAPTPRTAESDRRAADCFALATASRKPMLLVPPEVHLLDLRGPRRTLVPLDGTSRSSRATAPFVVRIVQGGSDVLLLHVFDAETVPHFVDQYQHAHEIWRKEFLARHDAGSGSRLVLRSGSAPEIILEAALSDSSDLLVMSCSGHMGPGRSLTVREVLAMTPVPVLLVPAERLSGDRSVTLSETPLSR